MRYCLTAYYHTGIYSIWSTVPFFSQCCQFSGKICKFTFSNFHIA
jgi:hypothetical protein